MCRGLHASANDDDKSTCEHAPAASEPVVDRGGEEHSSNTANVVHGENKTGS